ncbi:MAG: IclR family transcriptional regulator [Chloroflexota bacterium]
MRDNRVQSVTRAIELLKQICSQSQGIGIADLARQADLHKSTVSRLIRTLEAAGAVQRIGKRSIVQIQPDFARRFLPLHHPNTLVAIIRPFLHELSLQFGEAAGLAVPDGDQALYLDQVSPDTIIQVRDWTGSRIPLHAVAPGKLFLAYQPPEAQEKYLAQPLASYTPQTLTDSAQLRAALQEIRESGISWIFNEYAQELTAVAAPIFDQQEAVIAALVLFAPSYRFPKPDQTDQINTAMRTYAAKCTAQLEAFV